MLYCMVRVACGMWLPTSLTLALALALTLNLTPGGHQRVERRCKHLVLGLWQPRSLVDPSGVQRRNWSLLRVAVLLPVLVRVGGLGPGFEVRIRE